MKRIAVIGATGKLAVPVVAALVRERFRVKAIVRDPVRAARLLPESVTIVTGDLQDRASLRKALADETHLYLNLATETIRLDLPFYAEREGIKNVVEVAKQVGIKQILKIGGLGTYPQHQQTITRPVVPNRIRLQGHAFIEQCRIPYTLFQPTFFMDTIPWTIRGKAVQWVGKPASLYWISSVDYARQVVNAIDNRAAFNKQYAVQGPEAMTYQEAIRRFIRVYDPTLRLTATPVWLVRLLGLFSPRMRLMGHMFAYFERTPDRFYAQNTWDELGTPTTTIEAFAHQFRSRNRP